MNKNEIKNNCFKYFLYSLLAWDTPTRKVEDHDEKNACYFLSKEYKKKFVKELVEYRTKNVIKMEFKENAATSTNYSIFEKNNGEVIIAFRGSDSKVDWLADFSFFKKNFNDKNTELLMSMGKEDFDKLCVKEYVKSVEDKIDDTFNLFKNFKLKSIKDLDKIDIYNNFSETNKSNLQIKELFDRFKNSIQVHGGFLTQYIANHKALSDLIDKYNADDRFDKIIICGHSLGAALAELTYVFQSLRADNKKLSCYIAGTPKIGNASFNAFLKKSNLRDNLFVMNIKDDLVSMIPPEKFGFIALENDIEITPIPAFFNTKNNHTLFYYLYCIKNHAPIKIKDR